MNQKIKGIGGVFIYSENPKELGQWYSEVLGIGTIQSENGTYYCEYKYDEINVPDKKASISWSILPTKNKLDKTFPTFCINYRVDDLVSFVQQLKEKNIEAKPIEHYPEGKFSSIKDSEGNLIELWEPSEEFKN